MKTASTFLMTILFAAMAFSGSAKADTLIAGFETGLDGFGGSAGTTVATGATGATEGSSALQFTTDGGFDFTTSFSFQALVEDPANTSIKYDVLFTPDDIANQTFLQVSFGTNSDAASEGGRNPQDDFQFVGEGTADGGTQSSGSLFNLTAGVQTPVEQLFADLPDPDLTGAGFLGLFIVVNTDAENTGVLSIDNIRLHVEAVPEPSSLALLCGLGMIGVVRRRK